MFGFGTKKFYIRTRAVILREGKLLVVRHPHNPGFAVLPGGHLDWGENIKAGLEREIMEELGVVAEVGRLLYVNNFIQTNKNQYIEFFFEILNPNEFKDVRYNEKTPKEEISEIFWIDPKSEVPILPKRFGEDFKAGKVMSNEVKYISNEGDL